MLCGDGGGFDLVFCHVGSVRFSCWCILKVVWLLGAPKNLGGCLFEDFLELLHGIVFVGVDFGFPVFFIEESNSVELFLCL